ncbi:MAG: dihydrodipicolinate synthase family protein, partial [Chitinophagaceae bacterium]
EKKAHCEVWAEATKQDKDFKVITLTGGTSIADCIELAQFAKNTRLYGIALTAPFYFKPADIKQLAKCCIEVARSVPDMPFYYYHIPVLNGTNFPMINLLKELDGKLENLAGIKYTHEDFMDFSSCLNFKNGKYDMLWGRDENMLSSLVLGAKGAVGSTYNYAAPLYNNLIAAFEKNDLKSARALQQKAIDMIELLGKYGGIATGKAFMKLIGLDCGEFRLPVKNMNQEEFERFKKDVENVGFNSFKSVL